MGEGGKDRSSGAIRIVQLAMRERFRAIVGIMNPSPKAPLRPGLKASAVLLVVLLVGINGLAIGTLVVARSRADAALRDELGRRAEEHARAVRADLASIRGDLLFLSRSPSFLRLADLSGASADADAYRLRWTRLDAEGAALLFLRSHPGVERLVAVGGDGTPLLAAGRRGGAPIVLPAGTPGAPRPGRAVVPPVDAAAEARVFVDLAPDRLLHDRASGGVGLTLVEGRADEAAGADRAARAAPLRAVVPVQDDSWEPPIDWRLAAQGTESGLMSSMEHLASDYRNTVVLNVALIAFTALLGWTALREVREVARLEAERRQAERVRELELGLLHTDRLASLGRMAASIAHEINNPLEGMRNYLELAADDLRHGDADSARRHLDNVQEGLDRVAAIVRSTLRHADAGRAPKEAMDLRAVVERTVEFARENPKAVGTEIHGPGPSAAVTVHGNSTTLGQLVLNLVLNACEAQAGTGHVHVRVEANGADGIVRVDDEGPGLPADEVDRVFEPFYSTKGSTGLGLFLCHGIAEDHGGRLTAANRPEGGARLELRIPLATGESS
jgi:signal transduction histidine kinase